MSIPVKNPVPEINTSANIALSQWNDSVEKKELLSLDSFIDSIILNGAGTDVNLSLIQEDSQTDKLVYKLGNTSDVLLKVRLGSNTPDDIPELGVGSNYDITGLSGTGLVWDQEVQDMSVPVIFGLVFTITLTEDTTETYTGSDGSSIPKVRYIRNIESETFCKDWNTLFPTNFESCTFGNREYKRIVSSEHSDAAYLNVYVNGLEKSEEVGNTVRIFLPTFIGRYTNEDGLYFITKFLAGATNSGIRKFWQVPYARKSTVGSVVDPDANETKDVNEDKVLIRGETEVDNAKNINLVNGELYSYKYMDFQDDWFTSQSGDSTSNYILPFDDNFTEYNIDTQTVTKYPKFRLEIHDSYSNKKVYYSNEINGHFMDYEKNTVVGELSYDGNHYTVILYSSIIEENSTEFLNFNPFFEDVVVCELYAPMARLDDQEFRVKKITSSKKTVIQNLSLDQKTEIEGGEIKIESYIGPSLGNGFGFNLIDGFYHYSFTGNDQKKDWFFSSEGMKYYYDTNELWCSYGRNKIYFSKDTNIHDVETEIKPEEIIYKWDWQGTPTSTKISVIQSDSTSCGISFDKNLSVGNDVLVGNNVVVDHNILLQSLMFGKIVSRNEKGVRIGVFWSKTWPTSSNSVCCYSGPGDVQNLNGITVNALKTYLTNLLQNNIEGNNNFIWIMMNKNGVFSIIDNVIDLNNTIESDYKAGIIFQVVP
jgi:hypothetical protein